MAESLTKAIYIGRINAATKLEFYYYLPVGELSRETLNEWLGDQLATPRAVLYKVRS